MDLGDPAIERDSLDVFLDLAILELAFKGDELPLLEGPGELREMAPGIDAMPFGAGFVFALVVLPALLGCDAEDDVLFVVLSGFGFCVLSEAADEDDFVEHGVWLRFLLVCAAVCGTRLPEGCAARPTPSATEGNLWKGTRVCLGGGVHTSQRGDSGFREGERASEGRGCLERGTLHADRQVKPEGAGLFNGLVLMDDSSQKPAQGREESPQRSHAGRYKGGAKTNGLAACPVSCLRHGSPDVGSSLRRAGVAGEVVVLKSTFDPDLFHAIGISGNTEGDICGGGAVVVLAGGAEAFQRQIR